MTDQSTKPNRAGLLTVILGILSLSSYAVVFAAQDRMTDWTTRGGWYAALPIVMAFYFSVVHGAFAGHVLNLMGLEPSKKK